MAEYPAEVAALFDDLTAHFRRLLGEELVGIYLFGSLTQGSFDAARSDIDVMVVTRDHIDKGRSDLVRKWLEGMAAANLWTTRLQMMIIGRADILTMNARACHYQFGKFSRGGSDGNPIPWINILESGITLYGPPASEFVPEITPKILHATLVRELGYLREELTEKPNSEWRDRPKYRAYAILTVCRILYTNCKGKIVSKPLAAIWALRTLPSEWQTLINTAVAHDAGQPAKLPLPEIREFVRFAGGQIEHGEMPGQKGKR